MAIKKETRSHIINYAMLALGLISCCFTRFTFNFFIFGFLFPGCFLFFNRREKHAYITLPAIFAAAVIGCGVATWKILVNVGIGIQIGVAFILGALVVIPYILDKLVYTRFFSNRSWLTALLFPLTWITIDVILSFTPIASIASIGYCLSNVLSLTSTLSLFGMQFLSFTVLYFGTVVVQFIANPKKAKHELISLASVIGFSLAYTGIYQIVPTDDSKIVVMGALSTNDDKLYDRTHWSLEASEKWLDNDMVIANENHVELVVYPEEAFWVTSGNGDSIEFAKFLKDQSVTNNIAIVTGVLITENENSYNNALNCAWVATPDGDFRVYQKRHLLPYEEDEYAKSNDNIMTFDYLGSKIGVCICWDLEFEKFVADAGRMGCDMLIAPSWDWKELSKHHTQNNAYRAIENGVNFFKCTEAGYSLACNTKGQTAIFYYNDPDKYADKTTHETIESNHIFEMNKKGNFTLYSYLAPGIDFVYPIALAALTTVFGFLDHKKRQPSKQKNPQ